MKEDRVGALAILAVGILYLWQVISMPSASIGDPLGPKAFPLLLGILMILLGISIFFKPGEGVEISFGKKTLGSVMGLAVLLGVYGYTLPWIGYLLGTFLFLSITSRLLGEKSWILNILLSAGVSLGIYGLFTRILGIPLPLGIIQIFIG
jgi:putative tricarboxylic transport membrane protein